MPKFHRSSIFGDGPRVPLNREQRAVFKAKVRLQRRPGRISAGAEDVAEALLAMLGADGRLDPSHKTIAARAGLKLTAVKKALDRLHECGFLDWTRRLVRDEGTGWRAAQTSNAYVLRVPACEAGFRPRVSVTRFKKAAQEQGEGWEAQILNATRQLEALGLPIPAVWGSPIGAISR
jgi:hypothetical protein